MVKSAEQNRKIPGLLPALGNLKKDLPRGRSPEFLTSFFDVWIPCSICCCCCSSCCWAYRLSTYRLSSGILSNVFESQIRNKNVSAADFKPPIHVTTGKIRRRLLPPPTTTTTSCSSGSVENSLSTIFLPRSSSDSN